MLLLFEPTLKNEEFIDIKNVLIKLKSISLVQMNMLLKVLMNKVVIMNEKELKKIIVNIPDFPIKGIQFKDINPILTNPVAFQTVINIFVDFIKQYKATAIVVPEARGFIFGAAIAYKLGIKLVLARKKGKLPGNTYEVNYNLEYGTTTLEMHQDALSKQDRVVIIDDLIATSGTINACLSLVKQSKAETVAIAALISLSEFANKHQFNNIPLLEIIKF